MTDATTATTVTTPLPTIADIEKSMKAIDSLQKLTDWMLVAPDGRVWKGEPEKLLQVLIPHHPLLKHT